eukprot:XP_013994942.1 PREDICTED: uncharacterized protein LOC106568803 [Salmo salar]
MVPDVSTFVAACTVCAQNKTPWQAPASLLQPLPVPHRPWSNISLDFVMGLPPSDGNTTILTVVDRFSKAAHFIPLPKLPSPKETAQLMVQPVFRIHRLPVAWSPIAVLSSYPGSGRHSAPSWGRLPACPLVLIHSLTASWRKQIRIWRRLFVASSPPIPPPGASNSSEACRLKEVSDMSCPFLEEPVDIEAQIVHINLRRERVIRLCLDVLSFHDDYLFECFSFSAQSIIHLNNILSPHIVHMTHRGHALSSEQILCVALRFFANGSLLYNIGDAEHISKATICRAVRNVTLALKRLLYTFVVFPSHRPTALMCRSA